MTRAGKPPYHDDDTIRQLARIVSVPDGRLMQLQLNTRANAETVWSIHRNRKLVEDRSALSQLKEMRKAASKFLDVMDAQGSGARHRLVASLYSISECEKVFGDATERIAAIRDAADMALKIDRKFGKKNYPFLLYVRNLLRGVVECGGPLPRNDKNYRTGTLGEALKLLHRDLPADLFDPKRLPFSTLAKMRADWTKTHRKNGTRR